MFLGCIQWLTGEQGWREIGGNVLGFLEMGLVFIWRARVEGNRTKVV